MTTENNKIIAEFMGVSKSKIDANGQVLNFENSKYNTYNSDWNWLMEVVEKIEGLEFYPKNSTCIGFDSFEIEINKNRCDITRYGDFTHLLLQGQGKTRIEAVYNACIEFIKWYN